MADYENLVSAKGKAMWAKVNNTVDVYNGKEVGYTIDVYFDEATTKAMVADCDRRIAEAQASEDFRDKKGNPKKWREHPRVPYAKDDEGNTYFRFKTSHLKKDEEDNPIRKYVPVFDSQNKPVAHDVAIGNGSEVKVAYSPCVYHTNQDINGLKFFLNAVQVLKLVEFNGNTDGAAFGFGTEEGYSAPVDPEDGIEDPFEE